MSFSSDMGIERTREDHLRSFRAEKVIFDVVSTMVVY